MNIIEISIYELLDLLPSVILALVPFRNFMRFSRRINVIIIGLLYILMVISRVLTLGHLRLATILSILCIIFYLGFYKLCIRAELTKQLFVLLIILNYGSFVIIIFSYFAHCHLSPGYSPYSLPSIGILLLIYFGSYPIMFIMMDKKIRPLVSFPENNNIWRLLWLVPATSCLSYYFNLYSNGGVTAFSKSLNNMLFAAFLNIGNLFITFLIAHLVGESNRSMQLKAENYQLNVQFVQYENLKMRLDEARRTRHDFRQNILIIQSYLRDKDWDGLQSYISRYVTSLPADTAIIYCENYALNALLIYYADLAQKQKIVFRTDVDYPDDLTIEVPDAVTLLGNLLENAVEACSRQTSRKAFITLSVKLIGSTLIITLDNTYNGMIQKTGPHFISSKNNRIGIGITSVEKIAAKYQGITKFEYDDMAFHSSVLLYIPQGGMR